MQTTTGSLFKKTLCPHRPAVNHRETWLWAAAAPTCRADDAPQSQFISHQMLINSLSISPLARPASTSRSAATGAMLASHLSTRRRMKYLPSSRSMFGNMINARCPPVYKSRRLRAESRRRLFQTSNTKAYWCNFSNPAWKWCEGKRDGEAKTIKES